MEHAIYTLEQKISACLSLETIFESEMQKFNHESHDSSAKREVQLAQARNIAIKESCIKAINVLKSN